MRRLLMLVAMAVQGCIFGCSAPHWVGPTADNPGLEAHAGNFWTPAGFSMTGNTTGSIQSLHYTGHSDSQPAQMDIEGLVYGQNVSDVLKEQPAKIAAIAEAQRVQVEYVQAVGVVVQNALHELMPFMNLLASAGIDSTSSGMTMTLPNGFSLGKTKVSTPIDLSNYIRAIQGQMAAVTQQLQAIKEPTTQPTQ